MDRKVPPLGITSRNHGELPAEVRQAAQLLATGLQDKAVARHEDVTVRTVRRRIALLMDFLGASTRFQAGFLFARFIVKTGSPPEDSGKEASS
jgi:DNA-binding NarL/FixJ family response regulator